MRWSTAMRTVWTIVVLGAVAGMVPDTPLAGQGRTGVVQGTVTTAARAPRPLRVSFDQKVCGTEMADQSIIVDAAGHLANAVVSLVGARAAAPPRAVQVVNAQCAFAPRVQVAGSSALLKTASQDPVLHTTTVQLADGRQLFNVALPVPGLALTKPLEGTGPLRVGCSTHQWMRGWIYVTDDIAAVTRPDGTFTLPDVPPGTYQLRVWHEALRAADQAVTVAAGRPVTVTLVLK